MASTILRAGKRAFLLPGIKRTIQPRFISTTPRNLLDIDRSGPFEPPPSSLSGLDYDRSEVKPHTYGNPGIKASRDPLQHVLDHPAASIILRDACKCMKCKDHFTSQREFNLSHIPVDITPSSINRDAAGNWIVRWQNDMPGWEDHESVFTPNQLNRLQQWTQSEHGTSTRLWNKTEYTRDQCSVTYEEYMNSDAALAKTLYNFASYGLIFVKDVPHDESAVVKMAERIAGIRSTFYGPTWDIRFDPTVKVKNVAFTNKYLGFHGDLMYLKEPPTVQYLHCLINSSVGGESRFVDQFKAYDTLWSEDPELAQALGEIRLRYEYDNGEHFYTDIKPIIQWRTDSYMFPQRTIRGAQNDVMKKVYRAYWGPQFLGSIVNDFEVSNSKLKKNIAAMNKYAAILERDDMVYQEKMEPGTCVMFDNLRVLHARNEFEDTGNRWLRGTYIDAQELWSMEMKLKHYMVQFDLQATQNLQD